MALTNPTQNSIAAPLAAGRAGTLATPSQSQRTAGDLEKALVSIRQARDTLIARNLELSSKLAVADDRVSELEYEREASDQARDASLQLVQELSQQSDELRERVLSLTEENSALQITQRENERAAAFVAPDAAPVAGESLAEIEDLRRQLSALTAQNDLIKTQHAKHSAMLTSQLTAAQSARDIAVTCVTNAQRQVVRLASEAKELRAQMEADKANFEARIAQLEMRVPAVVESSSEPEPEVVEAVFVDPSASVVSDDVAAGAALIQECVNALVADHWNQGLLAELDERFHVYAASAGGLGYPGIARYSSACGELTRWLCKTPKKLDDTLQSLIDASALLVELSGDSRPEKIPDPAGGLVFSVDDDGDNCECIAMSLEKSSLRSRYAMKSEIALAELGKLTCDLIILDVDLPDMNGFELFDRIRAMPHHRDTPVIFLSGLMSTRDRLDSLPGNHQKFMPKPYNLNELGVIAFGMILKARLAKVAVPANLLIV